MNKEKKYINKSDKTRVNMEKIVKKEIKNKKI